MSVQTSRGREAGAGRGKHGLTFIYEDEADSRKEGDELKLRKKLYERDDVPHRVFRRVPAGKDGSGRDEEVSSTGGRGGKGRRPHTLCTRAVVAVMFGEPLCSFALRWAGVSPNLRRRSLWMGLAELEGRPSGNQRATLQRPRPVVVLALVLASVNRRSGR